MEILNWKYNNGDRRGIITAMFLAISLGSLLVSCNYKPSNPNEPDISINFTINPNSMEYFELNTVGGYIYIEAEYPSYGIIIYRKNIDEFMAYDRIPPNYPFDCENNRLFVDYPFVMDTCKGYEYLILDGSIVKGGSGYPLVQYFTEYDGTNLRVYN
ncbi:MAG: hypothetical protein ACI358_09345 [Candidatus Limimorpha sp.]